MESAHKDQLNAIKKIVNSKSVFIDIGACKGDILQFLCDNCMYGYAFEPDARNFEYLLKKYDKKNVTILNKVVSNCDNIVRFYPSGEYVGNILGHDMDYKKYNQSVEIESVSLDDFLKNIDVDFIKIDCEGAEWMIFDGAKETLNKKNIIFQVEFHLDEDWNKRTILYDYGYDIYTLDFKKIGRNDKRIYQGIVSKCVL